MGFLPFPHHRGVFDRVSVWQVGGAPPLASWGLVWIKIPATQKLPVNELSEITTFP